MSKSRKIVSLLLASALALSFVGCGSGSNTTSSAAPEGGDSAPASSDAGEATPTGDKVQLKLLHKWPDPETKGPFFDVVIANYEEANPNIDIVDEAVGDEPIKDKLRVLMGSNDRPDIFFSWSGEFANKFIAANAAYDLTPALEENDSEWKNSFMSAGLEPFAKDGKNYGIPLRIDPKYMIYHKSIFDQYGLTAPTTWDEFMNVCKTLKDNGVTPISFGDQYPWAACHYITGLNQQCVPQDVRMKDYTAETGEFTDPGYVTALQLFADLGPYFNEFPNSKSHDQARQTWAAGTEAMFYAEIEEFKQCDEANQTGLNDEWGFFPLPTVTDLKGEANYITGAPDGFMVSSTSTIPEEAIKFLKYITNMENQEFMVKTLAWPSPVIGATNESVAPTYIMEGMKRLEEADGMALWLDTDINAKISDVWLPGLQEILNGTITPEELMKKVQEMAAEVKGLAEAGQL
ncbi:MAG: hypothetical protein DBX66_05060 [Clostridiales bacterium]|uniref:Carbohydrate ABC transporter substrate-binding protein (CUT1 family) n=1 Tax=Harryflintia acetispora TaxID=1849041 RepID=A0A9X8UHC5_9FIRM|nr:MULTISPECIES: extracellular solute-binding protein [Oscillospiraceae]PWM37600.1 MAG: hypothetical protein DBX66_05060 [Clostridiales bacterium]RGB70002.1 extracellular solute-binding protein [Harryflintia acetispora]TCL42276.1 carbohydrate ABC transporter substrate-binding protein (CUT1 family) [Harryflintia acetispora]